MSYRSQFAALFAVSLFALVPPATAQGLSVVFSLDEGGPTIAVPDSGAGTPTRESDLLRPETNQPVFDPINPRIETSGAMLGLTNYSICLVSPPGAACGIELDALSYGMDEPIGTGRATHRIAFSVDEFAVGGMQVGQPSIRSESGAFDAASDVWLTSDMLPPGGIVPPLPLPQRLLLDGNGMPSTTGFYSRGIGLVEPNPPGLPPDLGDNLDALSLSPPGPRVYFSLDAGFNTGSAETQQVGLSGGDVLVSDLTGAPPAVYASAQELGLDLFGLDTDDIDALIIFENGLPGFQRYVNLFDWETGATDMLVFSVRRGSAVIGMIDSIQGLEIEAGDLLVPPLSGIGVVHNGTSGVGGPVMMTPGVLIPGESLGLQTTRSGAPSSDDLDGATTTTAATTAFDCNMNGVEDSDDIANMSSIDVNMNNIPDECEQDYMRYCSCASPDGPCGNHDPSGGCENSTGVGGMLDGSGSSSVAADDLVLDGSDLPPNKPAIFFMGDNTSLNFAFGDGRRCVGGNTVRFPATMISSLGTMSTGPGLISEFPTAALNCGTTWGFQIWHRDPMGPCGNGWNISSAFSVTWTP